MSSLAAVWCFVRALPLFFQASPKTPLRVLAIIALDTLHVLRTSRPLPRKKLGELALVLDFQACTNAAWDDKTLSRDEYRTARRRLEEAGLGRYVEEYLGRLRPREGERPPIGGDRRNFADVRAYREAVARVSLATLTAIALDAEVEDAVRATRRDRDVVTLYRLALQCQVIDDVWDYPTDLSAGLPSYLTATASLSEALELTTHAARSYGTRSHGVFPLRVALRLLSAAARLVVRMGPPSGMRAVSLAPSRAGMDPHYLLDGGTLPRGD